MLEQFKCLKTISQWQNWIWQCIHLSHIPSSIKPQRAAASFRNSCIRQHMIMHGNWYRLPADEDVNSNDGNTIFHHHQSGQGHKHDSRSESSNFLGSSGSTNWPTVLTLITTPMLLCTGGKLTPISFLPRYVAKEYLSMPAMSAYSGCFPLWFYRI